MPNDKLASSTVDAETEITLGLLNAVEGNSRVTQRSVAQDLGIALGLANAYLKRCIKKGYIKVSQAPANRYAYYLTPKGFAEKSRLTANYLSISFNFFREARGQCAEVLETCERRGWRRIAFCGNSELVEIATLCADNFSVEPVAIIDAGPPRLETPRLPVVARLDELENIDAVVITDLSAPQATFDRLVRHMPAERVLAPRFFNLSRHHPRMME